MQVGTIKEVTGKVWHRIKQNFFGFIMAIVVIVALLFVLRVNGFNSIKYSDAVEALKISVTVLVSMLGFSVSIYVFLNNTFQNRRSTNTIEKGVIEKFQQKKREDLGKSIIFSVTSIIVECLLILSNAQIDVYLRAAPDGVRKLIYLMIVLGCILVMLVGVCRLGCFTCGVINYEDGLRQLAKSERTGYDGKGDQEKIKKSEFLILVNNIEVLAERLIGNHLHAKTSSALDSDLKRAICDGETKPGEISTRAQLAEDYKKVIDYRNLLLQDADLKDSDLVDMGDKIKSVIDRFFQRYLKNELLTGVSISNLEISEADLSKTSFSGSFLQNISFLKETNLQSADFRNSTLSSITFDRDSKINCEGINFSDSKLIGIQFHTGMNLQRAIFTNADLKSMGTFAPEDKEGDGLKLSHAVFERANMTYLDIYNVCFDFANFNEARLTDSKIGSSAQKKNNTSFRYADMTKADLLQCVIERCDFQNANLSQAILTYAMIQDVIFTECRFRGASMSESSLEHCCFDKAFCTEMSLKGAQITHSTFKYATMASVDMSGATFLGCDFDDAVCRNSLLVRSEISGSSFMRCVLAGSRIVGENDQKTLIRSCCFRYADFSDAAITNIEFRECDFFRADFTNVRLINVDFVDCINLDEILTTELWAAEVHYRGTSSHCLPEPPNGAKWRYKDGLS